MNEYNLRPLWDELLKIYKVFASICDKHHLRYYACGGTALGAVRHKGFIPWDDDLDIFMPRRDYVRFMVIANAELPAGFLWQSMETDARYDQPFGKVRNADTGLIARIRDEANLRLEQGLFIDVLPLDGIPHNRICLVIWLVLRSIWHHLPSFLVNNQKARLLHQRLVSTIDFDRAGKVEDAKESAKRLMRTAWSAKTFGEPVWMDFESVKMPLPHDWDEYLRGMIGPDYMTLPPVEQRSLRHQIDSNKDDI